MRYFWKEKNVGSNLIPFTLPKLIIMCQFNDNLAKVDTGAGKTVQSSLELGPIFWFKFSKN